MPEVQWINHGFDLAKKGGYIFIPGEVPSKKNHKQIRLFKGSRPKLESSNFTKRYEKETAIFFNKFMHDFRKMVAQHQYPLTVKFALLRRTKQKFDYNNILHVVLDQMVKYRWIDDDDADHLIPIPLQYEINQQMFGVKISV